MFMRVHALVPRSHMIVYRENCIVTLSVLWTWSAQAISAQRLYRVGNTAALLRERH